MSVVSRLLSISLTLAIILRLRIHGRVCEFVLLPIVGSLTAPHTTLDSYRTSTASVSGDHSNRSSQVHRNFTLPRSRKRQRRPPDPLSTNQRTGGTGSNSRNQWGSLPPFPIGHVTARVSDGVWLGNTRTHTLSLTHTLPCNTQSIPHPIYLAKKPIERELHSGTRTRQV